jgi:predicted nucleic acid-binding protein
MSKPFLLDTSALMALIEDEPGAERVEHLLTNETSIIPWAALMEVFYMTMREKGRDEAETRFSMLKQSPAQVLWEMSEAILLLAASIKAKNRVSFADSIMAGFAIHQNAILVHKDPELGALTGLVELENLPYK